MRQIRRSLALVLVVVLSLGLLSGCSSSKTFGSVNALKITQAEYMFILKNMISSMESSYGATLSQLQEAGLDVTSTLVDLKDQAFDECVEQKLVLMKFDELGLTFDEEDQTTVTDYIAYVKEQVGGASSYNAMLEEYGITSAQYQSLIETSVKRNKIIETLYGEEGSEAITEEEELQYFTENYIRVKHVLFLTIDTSTNEALADDVVALAKTNYDDILARATAGEDFDAMVEEYSEDTGKASYPDGYIFDQYSSYVQEFLDTSFSLEVGGVGSCESSYGYHVIKRYPLDEDVHFADYKDEVQGKIAEVKLGALVDGLKETASIVKSDDIGKLTIDDLA